MIYKILVETNSYEDWQRVRDIFDNYDSTPMTQPYRFDIKASNAWRQIKVNRDQEYLDEQIAEEKKSRKLEHKDIKSKYDVMIEKALRKRKAES